MSKFIRIDSDIGEGGGQIIRIALSLSAIFKIPVEVDNIRIRCAKPGLAAQHLKGLDLARDMCNAKITGGLLGSTKFQFSPGSIDQSTRRKFYADTETADSVILMAQVALPIALFMPLGDPIFIVLKGGTNVPMSPQIEYFMEVFRPWLNKFGADFDSIIYKRGYYPRGGGEVRLIIKPIERLKAITIMDQGTIESISGWAYVVGSIPLNKAQQEASSTTREIMNILKSKQCMNKNGFMPAVNIEAYRKDRKKAEDKGSGMNIVCKTSSNCIYGSTDMRSNNSNDGSGTEIKAAEKILIPYFNGSCIDDYMQDQVIIFMAIASGQSKICIGEQKLTPHTERAIKITEMILASRNINFKLSKNKDTHMLNSNNSILECEGCGLINSQY